MAENNGWISLHRQIRNHWIWEDSNKLKWWLDMLLTVNTTHAKVNLGNDIFECSRGESLMSLQSWAQRWNVSKDTARNFIKLLEKDNMIRCVSIGKSTRITICNYDSYQGSLHVNQTDAVRKPNANQTQTHPNNNDNKENKENKSISNDIDTVTVEGDLNSLSTSLIPKEKVPRKRKVADNHPFDDSQYFDVELLSAKLLENENFKIANAIYYHQSAKVWSDKGNNQKNWLATIQNFILRDIKEGKMVTYEQKQKLSTKSDLLNYLNKRKS